MSTDLTRTRPTFDEDLYLEPLYTAATFQQLETRALAACSDATHETDPNVFIGVMRVIRTAVIVRRAELEVLSALRNAALAALVHDAHALSAYHVLPYPGGGFHVERGGKSIVRCSSREEALSHRKTLASAGAVA